MKTFAPRRLALPLPVSPRTVAVAFAALLASPMLTGCIGMGYSSGRGFFLFPSLGVLLVIFVIFMLLRRR